MPLTFWGEGGDARYKAAYFEEFKNPVWCQGDVRGHFRSTYRPVLALFLKHSTSQWITISSTTRGVHVAGRSDAVLNPSGVRFGSSELYAIVEEMKDDVDDCLAVGQKMPDGDERV